MKKLILTLAIAIGSTAFADRDVYTVQSTGTYTNGIPVYSIQNYQSAREACDAMLANFYRPMIFTGHIWTVADYAVQSFTGTVYNASNNLTSQVIFPSGPAQNLQMRLSFLTSSTLYPCYGNFECSRQDANGGIYRPLAQLNGLNALNYCSNLSVTPVILPPAGGTPPHVVCTRNCNVNPDSGVEIQTDSELGH